MGFAIVLRPLYLVISFVKNFKVYWDGRAWERLTDLRSANYVPWFGAVVSGEVGYNVFIITMSVLLILLFFRRRRMFPRLFIGCLVAMMVFTTGDKLAAHWMLGQPWHSDGGTLQLLGYSSLWIPYMLCSKRVRATFVDGPEPVIAAGDEMVAANPVAQ